MTMSKQDKWDRRYLHLADYISSWSRDPTTKHGAVVVRPNFTVASVGFNGFPIGCRDDIDLYHDRSKKLSRVVHAEMNAILLAGESTEACTLYVTGPTCSRCAAHVIQSNIIRVVAFNRIPSRWLDEITGALEMYDEAQVQVDLIG